MFHILKVLISFNSEFQFKKEDKPIGAEFYKIHFWNENSQPLANTWLKSSYELQACIQWRQGDPHPSMIQQKGLVLTMNLFLIQNKNKIYNVKIYIIWRSILMKHISFYVFNKSRAHWKKFYNKNIFSFLSKKKIVAKCKK